MGIVDSVKEKAVRTGAKAFINKAVDDIVKDPDAGIRSLVDSAVKLNTVGFFPQKNMDSLTKAVRDPDNVFLKMAKRWACDTDPDLLKNLIYTVGINAGYFGTKTVRANREKYNCNIPFQLLLDPTSACNLKCKGCWAAEYGHNQSLSNDELKSIIEQGKQLGTYVYMFTGGEPLIRKKDIVSLCRDNPDCTFLCFTNGTLIDQDFCDDLLEIKNLVLALSIEGMRDATDARRGSGVYDNSIKALELLKKNKLFYGISVCYTSDNIPSVTSDEFIDQMIGYGVKFGMYFNFMPVGTKAIKELVPSPEQRKYMYYWVRSVRNAHSGKEMLIMDFQHDGPYVGGCIAGGRNYFHINSSGDMEPCVFIHYSDSNIRSKTLLEALRSPLFMAYYHNQPFNDNHLRPCPMLENPEMIRKIVHQTGAKPTDLIEPEDVDTLADKCVAFAEAWAEVADLIWSTEPQPHPFTQYYRDTDEGKKKKQ